LKLVLPLSLPEHLTIARRRLRPSIPTREVADNFPKRRRRHGEIHKELDFRIRGHFAVVFAHTAAIKSIVDPEDRGNAVFEKVADGGDTSGSGADDDSFELRSAAGRRRSIVDGR